MSDSNGPHDAGAVGDGGIDADGDRTPEATADHPIPEPVTDDATAELVRDAIDVARGALSARQFSEKYDTGAAFETSDGGESGRTGGTTSSVTEENR